MSISKDHVERVIREALHHPPYVEGRYWHPLTDLVWPFIDHLEAIYENYCSFACPSVWKTGEPQPHTIRCLQIRQTLERVSAKNSGSLTGEP